MPVVKSLRNAAVGGQMQVHIPASIDEAKAQLGGLAQLLTARQWERAAIVYAFTEPTKQGQRNDLTSRNSGKLAPAAFAKLGIAGLRDEETVSWMREAWQDAIADGMANAAKPGDAVALPERDFPKHPRTRSSFDGFRTQLRQRPDAVAELIKGDPDLAVTLAEQVHDTPAVRAVVESRLSDSTRERLSVAWPERPTDYSADFRAAVNKLIPLLHAIRDGKWEPDATERTLAAFLVRAFSEVTSGEPTAALFEEIDAFLVSQEGAPR